MAFVAAAIGAIVKGIAGWTIAGIAVGRILLGVAINMGLSLLMQRRVNQRQPGMKIAGLSAGEERPLGFPLGRCATAGHLEYINSYGRHNKTPNAFLVLVISVSDLPGVTLNRLIVNDEYVTIDWDNPGERGAPITTFEQDNGLQNGWVRWYDGTQTEADPYLVEKFSGRGDRPWTEDHIGTGTAYAVITFRFRARKFRGVPRVRFELGGVPVYDPRKDTTAGGDGPHRLDDPATWEPSNNLAVLTWNVLRGIPLPEGGSWGGETPVEDLPLANWAAGMNACDEAPTGRPRYHGGLEVLYGDEPASVIDEFLAAGLGQITETGGVVRARWGAPSPAVYWLDDGSISVSDARRFSQGEGLAETTNALAVGFMSPAKLWQPFAVEPLFNEAWEAEDGRRLLAELQLPACWALGQARHLQRAYARDARRRRTHTLVLPPDAQPLECLDTIRWTSGVQGYENKLFEVVAALWLADGCVELTLRERDPDDYSWTAPDEPAPEVETPPPDATPIIDLPEWDASGVVLPGDGGVRRPGIRLVWDPEAVEDARAVEWELRLAATQEVVARGVAEPLAGEALVAALPATAYEARGRAVSDMRDTLWTGWTAVTSPAERLVAADIADGAVTDAKIAGLAAAKVTGQLSDAQIAAVAAAKLTGQIAGPQIADGAVGDAKIAGLAAAKLTGQIVGGQIADGAVSNAQIAGVAAGKVTGQLSDAQIAAVAAAKLTGQIAGTQITDGAISAPKIAAGAVEAAQIATDAVTAAKISAAAVTAGKIAAGAVEAGAIATGAVTTGKIAADAVLASKILVGDASNLIVDDLVSDPAYWGIEGADWANMFPRWPSAPFRSSCIEVTGAPSRVIESRTIPVEPGAWLFVAARAWREEGAGSFVLNLRFNDQPEFSGASTFAAIYSGSSHDPEVRSSAVEVPAGARYARLRLVKNADGITGLRLADPVIRIMARGELIVDGAIIAAKIAAGAVVAGRIAANAVEAASIAANAVTAAKINAGAVTTAKIAAGAVEAEKIAAGAIVAGKIAANAVEAASIAANAVTAAKINAGAVTTAKLAAGAVEAEKIAAGAVVAGKIAASAVEASTIAANAVTAAKINAGAVTTAKIAAGAVEAEKIAAGAVVAGKIAANAVEAASIAANAVTAAKINAGAVTTAKLAAGAVTADQIAANAVVAAKIAAGAVEAEKIAAGAVLADKIAAGAITASKLTLGDATNLYPDYDVNDPGFYASAQAFDFFGEANVDTGDKSVALLADGTLVTGWVPVDAGAELRVRAGVRVGVATGGRRGTVSIEFGTVNAGVVSPTRQAEVHTQTGGAWGFGEIDVTLEPSEHRFRFVLLRSGGTTGSTVRMGGLAVRRRTTGALIVDGAITAGKLAAGEIITSTAQIGALTVGTLQLQQGAVTVTRATDVASYALEPGAGWKTVASLSFTPFNPDVMLRCEALISVGALGFTIAPSAVRVRMRWRGADVGAVRIIGRMTAGADGQVAPLAIIKGIAPGGSGSGTLNLQINADTGITGGLSDIALDCMEFKR